jgi:hypothetical protein
MTLTQEGIVVRIPLKMAQSTVDRFLAEKKEWIHHRLNELEALRELFPPISYQTGDLVWVLGVRYQLEVTCGHFLGVLVEEDSGRFLLKLRTRNTDSKGVELALNRWYKTQAQELIPHRVRHYAMDVGKPYQKIVIKTLSRRWGSCSSTGILTFNWALMKAPLFVIDYVVVHELCHLLEMNHSPRFWQHVQSIFPEYKLAKQWLKDHGLGVL